MAIERTLSIIKPDATERNITGLIVARLEGAGLRVVAQKRVWWKMSQLLSPPRPLRLRQIHLLSQSVRAGIMVVGTENFAHPSSPKNLPD